jgi:hypothetical protein
MIVGCTAVTTQAAGHLVTVNVGQADIEDDEVGMVSQAGAHPIFAPVDGENLVILGAKIRGYHFGNIKVVFNDQKF